MLSQLGYSTGTDEFSTTLTTIPGLSNVKRIACGFVTNFAILTDGTVKAWGGNDYGELGIGYPSNYSGPTTMPGLNNVIDISEGFLHGIALLSDHTIRTWGQNDRGQLGVIADTTVRYIAGTNLVTGTVSKICAFISSSAFNE